MLLKIVLINKKIISIVKRAIILKMEKKDDGVIFGLNRFGFE